MTERMIENRLKKIELLETNKRELEKQIEELKDEIKEQMAEKEILETTNYIVKFTKVLTDRFDTKRFKKEFSEIYIGYTNSVESRRFSVVSR